MNPNIVTNTNDRAVGQFKIEGYLYRTIWYNTTTQTYTVTDKYGEVVDDRVPKEYRSLADLRSTYIDQYASIEFLVYNKHSTPIMVAGLE